MKTQKDSLTRYVPTQLDNNITRITNTKYKKIVKGKQNNYFKMSILYIIRTINILLN